MFGTLTVSLWCEDIPFLGQASASLLGFLGGVEEASLALNSSTFEVTLASCDEHHLLFNNFLVDSLLSNVLKGFGMIWVRFWVWFGKQKS